MKSSRPVISALLLVLLGLAGCGKPKPTSLPPATANGATLDMQALAQALASSPSPEVKAAFGDFYSQLRYSQYGQANADLDKIAADPSLTEAQKKAVADAKEQLKQMAAAADPNSKPAQ